LILLGDWNGLFLALARNSEKPLDIILVWKYSRFARSREDSIVYKAMLRKNGVQVTSINEPFDDTPTGRLMEAICRRSRSVSAINLTLVSEYIA
jgi:DNA invertase Pin-like site-specific DNA recombinase